MATKLCLVTSNGKRPSASAATIAELTAKAQQLIQLIDGALTTMHVQAPPTTHDFNYVAALDCKWRGPDAIAPLFEPKFARMEYVSSNQFNLSYRQHTGQWFEIQSNWTMDQCLKQIEENELFTP